MSDEITFLSRLAAEWRANARPMILADEVRHDDVDHKEIVAFVFVCTNTRDAARFADEATELRAHMLPEHSELLFKGSYLYGNTPRSYLDGVRAYVDSAISRCSMVVRVTTTSQTITRYKALAPGGIRREDADPARALQPVAGRELVPFMTMLKLTATAMKAGDAQIDVVLDRSKNLGLDPGQLRMDENQIAVIGPGTFNVTKSGAPATFICPSSFRLICPPNRSAFRDLLLLPDAIAYRTRPLLPKMREELSRVGFRIDVFPPLDEELHEQIRAAGALEA
jgi:hypothetical protein